MPKLEVTAPWDGSSIRSFDTIGPEQAERALQTAAALQDPLPLDERTAILERAAAIMRERRETLALNAAREGGKPLVDSLVEVDRAIDGMRLCVETIRTQAGVEIPMGLNAASRNRMAFTRWEPIGPVLAFSAFNHPLNLIVHQVGPAVAAGCPVIVKPAEATPISCFDFVDILREAGLPEEWCQPVLTQDHETSGLLASDARVGFFTFIGSGRVGWMLRSKLAPGTRCALEHGGAAPVIMLEDADLDAAIPSLAKGGFYHAGQVCVSVQRVFAARSVARELAELLAAAAQAQVVGDPTSDKTDVGPLIRRAEVDRVDTWVGESGGEVLAGAHRERATAYAPTVLYDPDGHAKLSREEIFGPVIAVYPVDDLDEAIRRSNELPFSFQASVFGRDIDRIVRSVQRLDAAAVMVNDHTAFRVDWMPFAGHKQSGLGTGGIGYTMRDMQREKLVVIRSTELT
ncbi:MAG: aldehyde dehydrogenase family protein [Planctomycetota bacterium]|jgi:acyl-CoA reductase-like NAD-dependent aldehyde dehydrogenase